MRIARCSSSLVAARRRLRHARLASTARGRRWPRTPPRTRSPRRPSTGPRQGDGHACGRPSRRSAIRSTLRARGRGARRRQHRRAVPGGRRSAARAVPGRRLRARHPAHGRRRLSSRSRPTRSRRRRAASTASRRCASRWSTRARRRGRRRGRSTQEILTDEVPIDVAPGADREGRRRRAARRAGTLDPDVGGHAVAVDPGLAGVAAVLVLALGIAAAMRGCARSAGSREQRVAPTTRRSRSLARLEQRGAPDADDADAWFVELSSIVRALPRGSLRHPRARADDRGVPRRSRRAPRARRASIATCSARSSSAATA